MKESSSYQYEIWEPSDQQEQDGLEIRLLGSWYQKLHDSWSWFDIWEREFEKKNEIGEKETYKNE